MKTGASTAERCLVIHPFVKNSPAGLRRPEARLDEITGLAAAIGLDVAHAAIMTLGRIKPSTLFGKGAVESITAIVAGDDEGQGRIDVAVIDASLSPIQQRNLERALGCKVIDRTGLILEIFGDRARTREGRLQVELAALSYQRSRLVRSWTHLERQRGGAGFMGGPGETQIETDRRLIDRRLSRLRRDLEDVKRTRELHRKARRRTPFPVVALVGYTNAGKSTLFNRLTDADVAVRDQLFATLDPTMRSVKLPSGRKVIMSDTVGFISELPHELVKAFHATLEEVMEADIVIHVRDAAHQDARAQKNDVLKVLGELGLDDSGKHIEVLNKIDAMDCEQLEVMTNRAEKAENTVVPVSALTGRGCRRLLDVIDQMLALSTTTHAIDLQSSDGAALAWLYDHGQVVERRDDDHGVHLKVRLDDADWSRFGQR